MIFCCQLIADRGAGKGGKYKRKGKKVSHTLTQDDIDFLKKNTRYDEQEIKEWYRFVIMFPAIVCYQNPWSVEGELLHETNPWIIII